MHVVHLLPELNQGDVETVVAALNRQLVLAGHQSTVISAGGRLAATIEQDGGRHIIFDVCSKNPLSFPFRVHTLRSTLRALRPTLIHVHSCVPAWLAWFANKTLRVPFVTTVHGFNSVSRYSAIMARGDRVICVSHPIKAFVQQHYQTPEERIRVIHPGIDFATFDPTNINPDAVESLRKRFALNGKFVVSSIGRITGLKDFETFIRAIALAHKNNPAIRGLIVGHVRADKRDYFAALQRHVSELQLEGIVHLATDLTNLPAVYAASNVLVSCSKQPESFGLTLVEALAMNIPVIATRHGGPLDIIREGENGFFFEPGQAEELAALFPQRLATEDYRNDALSRYSISSMTKATLDVYWQLTHPVELGPELFLGQGSHRAVYRHPEMPGKCLKVVKEGTLEKRRKNNKKWYKRLRPPAWFDETRKDLQAYRLFERKKTDLAHIPRFYGMKATSLGPAMLLDLVTNEDGTVARSLAHHLTSNDHAIVEKALTELADYLINSAIAVRDFSMHDVLARENRDGSLTFFIIDGLGGKELIPLSSIPFFTRMQARRRVRRFFQKITALYPDLSLRQL